MMRAVAEMAVPADYLLIDWVRLHALSTPQESHIRADAYIVSVAAASILAKVWRDNWMCEHASTYPDFAFAANKGYGTSDHLAAITRCGPCSLHRRSFAPMRLGLFEGSLLE
jgi:ribonuclease HII